MLKAIIIFLGTLLAVGPILRAQTSSAASKSAGGTAGEVMKNVQVLKDVPAADFNGAMAFVAGSLGVGCEHCHAEPYSADTKKAKLTARSMMRMVEAINNANFERKPMVTCYTCHQGRLHPEGMPAVWNKTPEELEAWKKQRQKDMATSAAPVASPQPAFDSLPPASQIFANYRKAVGLSPVKSIRFTATIASATQPARPFTLEMVLPDKFAMLFSMPGGAQAGAVISGNQGWSLSPAGRRPLPVYSMERLRENITDGFMPVRFPEAEASGRLTGTEEIEGRQYSVVECHLPGKAERLYFDSQSGLLYKVHLETDLARFGVLPAEVTFEDYREVQGIKLPFLITSRGPEDQSIFKIAGTQINAPIDESKFESPASTK